MNRFGEIADELTDLIEELDDPRLAEAAGPLQTALERAFARACEAERALRKAAEAERAKEVRAVGARWDRASRAPPKEGGVVIRLPVAWRGAPRGQSQS
jgi:hypothetical protein